MHNFLICIDNTDYEASLETRKVYERIEDDLADKKRFVRVIDESGEDYLFPDKLFISLPMSDDLANRLAKIA
jgi:hypothetical protein